MVENLFGSIDPVGQMIRIKKVPFMVIGVLDRKGQSPQGQDQDDTIYIPVTTAQKKIFGTSFPGMVRTIMVKARSTEDLAVAEKQINELLRQRHHLSARQDNDFTVRNLTQIMQVAEQSTKVMTLLLGAIASVSLLVGGIGIMNIMLVSVTERTREIGIRMAVGAKTWDIRLQFIIEALTLAMIGGITGISSGSADQSFCPCSRDGPPSFPHSPSSWRLAFRDSSGSSSVSTRPIRPPSSTRSMRSDTSDRVPAHLARGIARSGILPRDREGLDFFMRRDYAPASSKQEIGIWRKLRAPST